MAWLIVKIIMKNINFKCKEFLKILSNWKIENSQNFSIIKIINFNSPLKKEYNELIEILNELNPVEIFLFNRLFYQ